MLHVNIVSAVQCLLLFTVNNSVASPTYTYCWLTHVHVLQAPTAAEVRSLEPGGLEDGSVQCGARRAPLLTPDTCQQHLRTSQLHTTQRQIRQALQAKGACPSTRLSVCLIYRPHYVNACNR